MVLGGEIGRGRGYPAGGLGCEEVLWVEDLGCGGTHECLASGDARGLEAPDGVELVSREFGEAEGRVVWLRGAGVVRDGLVG